MERLLIKRIYPMLRRGQRGDTLIVTLIVLVLLLLGFIYSSRNILSDTIMTGNNAARQRSAQIGDIALRQVEHIIISASNSFALESPSVSANVSPWFVNKLPTVWTQTSLSWPNCSSSPATCGTVTGSTMSTQVSANSGTNYTAYYTVQPLGIQSVTSCAITTFTPVYYAVYLYVVESGSGVASTNESILRLCVQGGS